MISMTTARRHPDDSPRRHRGACVVALYNADAAPEAQKPLSNQAKNAGVATGSRNWGARERVTLGRHLRHFNADRLTDSGLKPEMGPACHTPHKGPRGLAHSAGQGSTAQPGGRRQFQRSGIRDQTGVLETLPCASNTDAACFKGMGSFRLASQTGEPYTTRPAAPFNV